MGLHTGNPQTSGANYVGMDLHRVARIMSAGHGDQVLVSETTAALVDGTALRDLGRHRLKDMLEPIQLHQLAIEGLAGEFPPLRSLHRTNLPTAAWPLLGREHELARDPRPDRGRCPAGHADRPGRFRQDAARVAGGGGALGGVPGRCVLRSSGAAAGERGGARRGGGGGRAAARRRRYSLAHLQADAACARQSRAPGRRGRRDPGPSGR